MIASFDHTKSAFRVYLAPIRCLKTRFSTPVEPTLACWPVACPEVTFGYGFTREEYLKPSLFFPEN
jgi:hypothetical protein